MTEKKRGRGGNVKKPPDGYYTAKQAYVRLGMPASTFWYYVRQGKIKKVVPPMRKEGFYRKQEIDRLATETELLLSLETTEEETPPTETHVARPQDAQGIYDVLDSFGWQTTPVAFRLEWYKVNPQMDYVVRVGDFIGGYLTCIPYTSDALEAIMSGRKRAWHMIADDILPYEDFCAYDTYVGIAVRQDIPNHTILAFRLIAGFLGFLEELAREHRVIIRRMYAVSAEKDGQRLCRALGFIQQEAQEGDMFPRFMLDLETSESRFAQRYREALIQKES